MAVQSSLQLHSPDQSTTWRGISGAVVRDALATCRCGPRRTGLHCSHKLIDDLEQLKDPHNGGHLLTGVGARQQAVGNARVATPRVSVQTGHGMYFTQGRRPKNRAGETSFKNFAPACVSSFCPRSSVGVLCLVFLRGWVFCCSGAVLFSLWLPSVGADSKKNRAL